MKSWTIKPVVPGGVQPMDVEPPDGPTTDRPSIDEDASKFESLLNAPRNNNDPILPAGINPPDAERPHMAINDERLFGHDDGKSNLINMPRRDMLHGDTPVIDLPAAENPSEQDLRGIEEQTGPDPSAHDGNPAVEPDFSNALLVAGQSQPRGAIKNIESTLRLENVHGADITARVEITELISRLADRIVVEGPTTSQSVVEIHLSEAVLPDTVVRVTRSDLGLEVALTTLDPEAHTVLNHAAAGLGERLVALEGGLPVLITVEMHGGAKSEFSFGESSVESRHKDAGGRRDERQRKSDHGHP